MKQQRQIDELNENFIKNNTELQSEIIKTKLSKQFDSITLL